MPSTFEFQAPIDLSSLPSFWTAEPPLSAAVSFDAAAPMVEAAAVWRVNLPADLAAATDILAQGETQTAAAWRTLAQADARLERLATAQPSVTSYGVDSSGVGLDAPEVAALALLNGIETGTPALSFGLGEQIDASLDAVVKRFQEFVDGLRTVLNSGRVETWIDGRLVCQTHLGLTGRAQHIWLTGADATHLVLHQRALTIALASRRILMQTLVVVAQSAVKLSALLAAPGSLVLALPVAWKFICQVLAGDGEHPQSISHSEGA